MEKQKEIYLIELSSMAIISITFSSLYFNKSVNGTETVTIVNETNEKGKSLCCLSIIYERKLKVHIFYDNRYMFEYTKLIRCK